MLVFRFVNKVKTSNLQSENMTVCPNSEPVTFVGGNTGVRGWWSCKWDSKVHIWIGDRLFSARRLLFKLRYQVCTVTKPFKFNVSAFLLEVLRFYCWEVSLVEITQFDSWWIVIMYYLSHSVNRGVLVLISLCVSVYVVNVLGGHDYEFWNYLQ